MVFKRRDVIAILTDSDAPNQYWRDMKRRMTGEGWAETQANCLQLKMLAPDGKKRLTAAEWELIRPLLPPAARRLTSRFQPSERIVAPDLAPVLGWERKEG